VFDKNRDGANRIAREISETGGKAFVSSVDITDYEAVGKAIGQFEAEMGPTDVLVNNAGWTVDRLFVEQPREDWVKLLNIELWGWLNCTRAVLDHMIERRRGRIVSIGSDAGRIGEWREVVHSGAKAAVMAMSKALAKEVGRYGITVNVVSPGFTPGRRETSGALSQWAGPQGEQFPPELLEKIAKSYPLRRLGTPEDVLPVVLLLASDLASYVTGQTWSVSGGYTMV
jgi:2-hydroxycyclohexanecarboxyl-CoA dehydrogenase